MKKKNKVICIIPARGGSKGLKLKNLPKAKNGTALTAERLNRTHIHELLLLAHHSSVIQTLYTYIIAA